LDNEKRKFWLSVFLSILIILSVLGTTLTSYRPNPQNTEATPAQPTPISQAENFIAKNVDANITELTTGYKIYGYTENYNIYELTEQIRGAGFERVDAPAYRTNANAKTLFVFDTSLRRDENIDSLLNALEKNKILENPGAYRKAVIKIPANVRFENPDTNEKKDINFEEPFLVALVALDSLQGDKLKVTIYAQIQGNQLIRNTINAYEEDNLSIRPLSFKQDINAQIESIENAFNIFQSTKYAGFDDEKLKADVLELHDINDFTINLLLSSTFNANISLDANKKNASEIVQDLNKDLNSIVSAPITSAKISYDENSHEARISITFETKPAKNYALARESVSKWLEKKGLQFEIEPVQALIDAKVSLAQSLPASKRRELGKKIVEIFAKHSTQIDDSRFVETGYIKANSVKRPDTNAVVNIVEPVRTVLAFGHEPGEYVEVELNFYMQRDVLLGADAVEKRIAYAPID